MKSFPRAVIATCAALSIGAVTAPGADAGAPDPTGRARSAGIVGPGGGYLGWADRPSTTAATTSGTSSLPAKAPAAAAGSVLGMDVSGHQGKVDWPSYYNKGFRFVWTKATEGSTFKNSYFTQQYNGSYRAGFIRGAYHFANPGGTSGAAQATFFVKNGGGWSGDGKTLPGVLDVEYNPYGATCYGLSKTKMVSWIRDFLDTYKKKTTRDAVIYTTTDWWKQCTGNTDEFSDTNPLWIARYSSSPGTLPGSWTFHTIWQWTDSPIDQNSFNGNASRLKAFADG